MPAAIFAFAFPIAWLDAAGADPERPAGWPVSSPCPPAVLGVGALAVAVSVGWGLASERSALRLDEAKTALGGRRRVRGGRDRRGCRLDRPVDPARPARPRPRRRAGRRSPPSSVRRSRPSSARTGSRRPGSTSRGSGRRPATRRAPRRPSPKASGSASSRPRSRSPPARSFERLGDIASADHWYATALAQLPRLAADPYWHGIGAVRIAGRASRPSRPTRACPRRAAWTCTCPPGSRTWRARPCQVTDPASAARRCAAGHRRLGRLRRAPAPRSRHRRTPRRATSRCSPGARAIADRAGDHDAAIRFRFLADMQYPGAGDDGPRGGGRPAGPSADGHRRRAVGPLRDLHVSAADAQRAAAHRNAADRAEGLGLRGSLATGISPGARAGSRRGDAAVHGMKATSTAGFAISAATRVTRGATASAGRTTMRTIDTWYISVNGATSSAARTEATKPRRSSATIGPDGARHGQRRQRQHERR